MKDTNNSNEILTSKSFNVIDKIMHFYSIAKEFSTGSYSDPTPTGTNETIKIDMQYKDPILYEAKLNQDGAKSLSSYLKNDEESINAWAICVFAMTFVFIILTILSIVKRYSTLIKVIGVLLFIISALSFIGTGLWIREVYKLGDYCEQDQKLMNGNYNDAGKGVFYFLNCFNDTNLIGINIAIFQTIFALKNSTQYYMNYLKEIDMNEYNQTLSQSDIIKNYKLHPDNSSLIHWGDAISMLDGALQDALQLKQCIPTRQYASFAEKNFCKNGLDDAYLGYIGLLVESVALVLLSWAALNLRPVIEKFKEESETMISVRDTA